MPRNVMRFLKPFLTVLIAFLLLTILSLALLIGCRRTSSKVTTSKAAPLNQVHVLEQLPLKGVQRFLEFNSTRIIVIAGYFQDQGPAVAGSKEWMAGVMEPAVAVWRDASAGKLTISYFIADPIAIPRATNGTCSQEWEGIPAGVPPASPGVVDRYLYYFSDPACRYGGEAMLNGATIQIQNNFAPYVIAHELGHSFGLNHARRIEWQGGVGNLATAIIREYGDVNDVMGGGTEVDAFDKAQLFGIPIPALGRVSQTATDFPFSVQREDGIPYILEIQDGTVMVRMAYYNQCFVTSLGPGEEYDDQYGGVRLRRPSSAFSVEIVVFPPPTPTPVDPNAPTPVPTHGDFGGPTPGPVPTLCAGGYLICTPTPSATFTPTPTPSPSPTGVKPTEPPVVVPPETPTPTPTDVPVLEEPTPRPPTPTPTGPPVPPPWTPPARKSGCVSFSLSSVALIAGAFAAWRRRLRR